MKQREIVIVLGKTGFGKSTWARDYIQARPRVFGFDPLREMQGEYLDEQALVERFDSGELAEKPRFCYVTDSDAALDAFGHTAFLTGNCLMAVEEASLVFRKGERIDGWARSIIFVGRHRNVSLLVTAQRAASIPIELRSQASRVVSFSQHESDDLNWLKPFFGKQVMDLPMLPKYTCLDAREGQISTYHMPKTKTPAT